MVVVFVGGAGSGGAGSGGVGVGDGICSTVRGGAFFLVPGSCVVLIIMYGFFVSRSG